jgi:type II secretory pathway predicted ATPase ExeA
MYKRFYKLVSNPFRLAPEPDFCFSHTGYRCAREYLEFALAQGEGFVMVTGRPGTGKTMLVETFLKGINTSEVAARRIAVSNYGAADLLRAVAYAYGIDAAGLDKGTLRRVLLIIDEAQTLSHAALEELRILADLQTESRLMLQLFLVGQENLQELMRSREMEQFQQRVIANYKLVPLNLKDTRAYIEHRLLQAGWQGDPEFSSAAVMGIYQLSKGVPRHINKICNRLLLLGFGKGSHSIDDKDVQEISVEMHHEQLAPLQIDQPEYDADNVTNMSAVRDGQLSATDLSIRADKIDSVAIALSERSRMAAHNRETLVSRHDTPPVSNDDSVSPDLEVVVPVDLGPEPILVGNAKDTAEQQPETATHTPDTPAFSLTKALGVAVIVLVALLVTVANVPSLPGHDRVQTMLSSSEPLNRWKRSVAAMSERLVGDRANANANANANADVEVVADAEILNLAPPAVVEPAPAPLSPVIAGADSIEPVINDYQPAAGAIIRDAEPRAVPQQVTPAAVTTPATSPSGDVETLLVLGRQALNEYRLVTPEGDNAYEYLAAALQLDADNAAARAGIQEIVNNYIALAQQAIDANELARAARYLERGLGVQPDNPELVALKASLDDDSTVVAEAEAASSERADEPRQLTRESMPLQKRPPMMKRLAADRQRGTPEPGSLGI